MGCRRRCGGGKVTVGGKGRCRRCGGGKVVVGGGGGVDVHPHEEEVERVFFV